MDTEQRNVKAAPTADEMMKKLVDELGAKGFRGVVIVQDVGNKIRYGYALSGEGTALDLCNDVARSLKGAIIGRG